MKISNLNFLNGDFLARAASWACFAAAVSLCVKDRFPSLPSYAETCVEKGVVLLTTAVVMGGTYPYSWLNVAIGPVCLVVWAIYKKVSLFFRKPPDPPMEVPQIEHKRLELSNMVNDDCVCSKGPLVAHGCELNWVTAVDQVELTNTNCHLLALRISGIEGTIKLQNATIKHIHIMNHVGSGWGKFKIRIEGVGRIPPTVQFYNCLGSVDSSKLESSSQQTSPSI